MKKPLSSSGAALGMLIALWAMSYLYVQSAWAILLGPFWIPIAIGLTIFMGYRPPSWAFMQRPITAVLLIFIGWPVAMMAPYTVKYVRYWVISDDLPFLPDATDRRAPGIIVMHGDGFYGARTSYRTKTSVDDAVAFYEEAMRDMKCQSIRPWISNVDAYARVDGWCNKVSYEVRYDEGVVEISAR